MTSGQLSHTYRRWQQRTINNGREEEAEKLHSPRLSLAGRYPELWDSSHTLAKSEGEARRGHRFWSSVANGAL